MKKILLLLLLVGAGMACSLTSEASGALVDEMPSPARISTTRPVAVLATLTPSPTSSPGPALCLVTAHALTLRAGPGVDFPALEYLTQGETLTILTPGYWLEVRTQTGKTGYINSTYCDPAQERRDERK